MIRKTFLLGLAGLLICSPSLRAQNNGGGGGEGADQNKGEESGKPGESTGPARFWQATVGGGTFMVALDKIASISRHKYVLDGSVIVDEVTVDTVGQALARFYFITPVTDTLPGNAVTGLADHGKELLEGAAERTGTGLEKMVVKKYPDTTHAKSLEYRVESEQELKSLYSSVQSAWESGRGRKFTAK